MIDDPRIDELMEFIDSVDDNGEPTSIALIARRVASYLEVVKGLRQELDESHASVLELEGRAENLATRLEERESLSADITLMAQDAAIKAAFSSSGSRSAQLRKDVAQKQSDLKQFQADYDEDSKRLVEVKRALNTRHTRLIEARDQIARRMNIIDALLQRAEIEWPSHFFEENSRIKSAHGGSGNAAARPAPKGRSRARRRVVRRRRAS